MGTDPIFLIAPRCSWTFANHYVINTPVNQAIVD
jgi:hypothetical protein